MQEESVPHRLMSGTTEPFQIVIAVEFAVATEVLHLKGKMLDRFFQFINRECPWSRSLAVLDSLSKSIYKVLSLGNVWRNRCKHSFNGGEFILHRFPKGHCSS